ncbi:Properdin [Manis pentadactyla]|nr:Properdin [Manis pentadactyla]
MVPPLPESKANECAGILGNGVKCCGMEQNVVLCYAIEAVPELFEAMGPSYTEWNAMECGGMLPNGVQLRMECKKNTVECIQRKWRAVECSVIGV